MGKVKFYKGLKADLPSTGLVTGHYYQCTDTGELYLAISATELKLVGTGSSSGGGVEEAPEDGKAYLRQNGGWTPYEDIACEKVVLHISAEAGELPTPIAITVKNNVTDAVLHNLSWEGSDLVFFVGGNVQYRIEFGKAIRYSIPSPYIRTAIAGTQRNVDTEYTFMTNGVYIGYTDGTVSPYNQDPVAGKTVKGVVLKTDDISICIHKTQVSSTKWSSNTSTEISGVTTTTVTNTALQDFAGKSNTDAVIASGLAGNAFTFATELGDEWYLPACGEMEQIRLNKININTAMSKIGCTSFNFNYSYWSSTQYNDGSAWRWSYDEWGYNLKSVNIQCRAVCGF